MVGTVGPQSLVGIGKTVSFEESGDAVGDDPGKSKQHKPGRFSGLKYLLRLPTTALGTKDQRRKIPGWA